MNSNKEVAISYLRLVTSGKIREAFERHVGPGFCHHNPYYKSDAESLMTGMQENDGKFPGKIFEIRRALGEGEVVAVHSNMKLKPGELEVAVVHIFRFHDKRIVELWDICQVVPDDSLNEKGMF